MMESFRNLKISHIEPIYLIRVCLHDLWMVILASLCCAMLAGTVLILFFPNRVQADVTLVVTNRVANASVIQTSKSATQAAETFSSLINTDLVRTRIAKEAGYPEIWSAPASPRRRATPTTRASSGSASGRTPTWWTSASWPIPPRRPTP